MALFARRGFEVIETNVGSRLLRVGLLVGMGGSGVGIALCFLRGALNLNIHLTAKVV